MTIIKTEKILNKYCLEFPAQTESILVSRNAAINAMQEYADQETSALRSENERLRAVMKQLYVMYNREVMFPDKLEKYWKEFLTENNL